MQNDKNVKSAEAQVPKAPSEEDFVGLVKYLEEREKNLSKYSDKLRENLAKIAGIFGDESCCQICGFEEGSTKHVKYRDEQGYLHDEKTSVVNGITVTYAANKDYSHAFKAKIEPSFEIEDETEFRVIQEENNFGKTTFRLILLPDWGRRYNYGGLLVKKVVNDYEEGAIYQTFADECSRESLKTLVQKGRLPKFLAYAAKKLAEKEQEYQQVAEAAEKMAASLQ
jgi:hypothetical protein